MWTCGVWRLAVVLGGVAACVSPGDTEELGRSVQGLSVSGEITFPPPTATDPSDARGPVSLTRGTDRWLVGFYRTLTPTGLVVRAYDLAWNPLTPAQTLAGSGSYGVSSLNASSALAVWSTSPTAANLVPLTASGVLMGTPTALPSPVLYSPFFESTPAIGWTSSGAIVAWRATSGAQSVVRVSRVSAAGVLLDGPSGVAISNVGAMSDPLSLACMPSGCLVAWTDTNGVSSRDTFVRRIDANAVPLDAAPVRVGATLRNRLAPEVASDGTRYLVVWHERDSTAPMRAVYARRMMGSTGQWLDANPLVVGPLSEPLPFPETYVRSAVAWNGNAWGVVTAADYTPSFAALGADGSVVIPSRPMDPGGPLSFHHMRLAGSGSGWVGIYSYPDKVRRFEIDASGATRAGIPVQDLGGPTQPFYGVGWANGRFIVGVNEGLWRVAPAGVREGTAAVPYPGAFVSSFATPTATTPVGLVANGGRVMLASRGRGTAAQDLLHTVTIDGALTAFSTTQLAGAGSDVQRMGLAIGPGNTVLGHIESSGVGFQGAHFLRFDTSGALLSRLIAGNGSADPVYTSSTTETLVLNYGFGPPCVDTLLLLNDRAELIATQELSRSAAACTAVPSRAVASNGSSFLAAQDSRAILVRGGGSITLGSSWTTWPSGGTALGAVWNGSAYVVLLRRVIDANTHELSVRRISASGALLDANELVVGRCIPPAAGYRPAIASDGAGRVAVLYGVRFVSTPRAVLRIIDWNDTPDGGVDAGTDARLDVAIDTAVDAFDGGLRDVPVDIVRDAQPEATVDVPRVIDGALDAPSRDVPVAEVVASQDASALDDRPPTADVSPEDVSLADAAPDDAPQPADDVASDAPSPPPDSTGCACTTVGAQESPRSAQGLAAMFALSLFAGRRARRRDRTPGASAA